MEIEDNELAFICNLCDKGLDNVDELQKHMKGSHGKEWIGLITNEVWMDCKSAQPVASVQETLGISVEALTVCLV